MRCTCRKRGTYCKVHKIYNVPFEAEAIKRPVPHGWQPCRGGRRIVRKKVKTT